MDYCLGVYEDAVNQRLGSWREAGLTKRLLNGDQDVWTGDGEGNWLGWMDLVSKQESMVPYLKKVADTAVAGGITDVLLLGMGGSSLCPEVLARTFGSKEGYPELHVLDSTVPAQVLQISRKLAPNRTLYIVASKSGSTTEPNAFCDYFFARALEVLEDRAGEHFVAITDPGSSLEGRAEAAGFQRVIHGIAEVGGRFSALSNFGLFPAATMGLDLGAYMARARQMEKACRLPDAENPGVLLGIILGELAMIGRDKLTIVTSPGVNAFGSWLEQLIAESTGKSGKGIIPVDGEPMLPADRYNSDRLFVHIALTSEADENREGWVESLQRSGHPVVAVRMDSPLDLGAEFYRWEMATAVAGAVLEVNPFDQPNVQESKDFTERLTQQYIREGSLPEFSPVLAEDGISVYGDVCNGADQVGVTSLDECVKQHLGKLNQHDYFALCAYIDMTCDAIRTHLESIRAVVGFKTGVATTLGFGPRFLHSTGQLHKGGPNKGLFFQITADDEEDLDIPGTGFSFGTLKSAQAIGDLEALSARGRRVMRFHLGRGVEAGLLRLLDSVEKAMA
jgi:transaldolase/glucose-6-phosphate isomerase